MKLQTGEHRRERCKSMLAKDDLGGSWREEEETINMNIIFLHRGTPGAEISLTNTRMQPPALRPIGAEEGWEGKGRK